MSVLDAFVQPTLGELRDFYRSLPKREKAAITRECTDCLIAVPIRTRGGFDRVAVQPDEYSLVIDKDFDSTGLELDPALTRLAEYFDSYDGSSNRQVSNGACARIIERFAKQEGIAL